MQEEPLVLHGVGLRVFRKTVQVLGGSHVPAVRSVCARDVHGEAGLRQSLSSASAALSSECPQGHGRPVCPGDLSLPVGKGAGTVPAGASLPTAARAPRALGALTERTNTETRKLWIKIMKNHLC